jgi:hypothetical protein
VRNPTSAAEPPSAAPNESAGTVGRVGSNGVGAAGACGIWSWTSPYPPLCGTFSWSVIWARSRGASVRTGRSGPLPPTTTAGTRRSGGCCARLHIAIPPRPGTPPPSLARSARPPSPARSRPHACHRAGGTARPHRPLPRRGLGTRQYAKPWRAWPMTPWGERLFTNHRILCSGVSRWLVQIQDRPPRGTAGHRRPPGLWSKLWSSALRQPRACRRLRTTTGPPSSSRLRDPSIGVAPAPNGMLLITEDFIAPPTSLLLEPPHPLARAPRAAPPGLRFSGRPLVVISSTPRGCSQITPDRLCLQVAHHRRPPASRNPRSVRAARPLRRSHRHR